MHRIGFLSVAAAVYLFPTMLSAETIVSAGDWFINPAAGQSVDTNTLLPIAVVVTGSDQVVQANLFMTSGPDGVTPLSGPLFQAIDMIGPGTIYNADRSRICPELWLDHGPRSW